MHVSMALPDNRAPGYFALSPDGRSLVMGVPDALAIRSLETGETGTLPGTSGYRTPFWSPDSQRLAYTEGTSAAIKVRSVSGGAEQTRVKSPGVSPSDWSHDDRWLVYTQVDPRTPRTSGCWLTRQNHRRNAGRNR